jgi:hypothetical protein
MNYFPHGSTKCPIPKLNPHASKELQVKFSCINRTTKNLKASKNETPMHQVVAPHINKTTQNINLNF